MIVIWQKCLFERVLDKVFIRILQNTTLIPKSAFESLTQPCTKTLLILLCYTEYFSALINAMHLLVRFQLHEGEYFLFFLGKYHPSVQVPDIFVRTPVIYMPYHTFPFIITLSASPLYNQNPKNRCKISQNISF